MNLSQSFENPKQVKKMLLEMWGNQANEPMTPYERILRSLAHKQPDRVPFDYFAVPELTRELIDIFDLNDEEDLLQLLGSDGRRLVGNYRFNKDSELPDGSYYDTWGSHRRIVRNETSQYDEIASFPLADYCTRDEIYNYRRWPDPKKWDWNGLLDNVKKLNQRTRYYYRLHIGGIFETAWALYGMEKFLMDLYLKSEIPCAIMDKITDILVENVRNIRDTMGDNISMIATYDDVASQEGLIISPDLWRKYIMPRHERVSKEIKKCGYKFFFHSCGSVAEIVPDFIAEMGIDMLDPLQPRAKGMDLEMLKNRYGNNLSFHGGVDLQHTMPFGTTRDVQKETEWLCRILGKSGGYICSGAHHLQADTPWQNVAALYSTKRA
jgi:uroporphyrinogen decarboxylase